MAKLHFIPPMLPTLVEEAQSGDQWLHEIKYDGYRTQLIVENGTARAFTRRGHDWTERYGPIAEAAAGLACSSAILDGEMIIQGPQGRSDYHALRAGIASRSEDFVFMAFDLLHLDGRDLRKRPLEGRRAALEQLLGPNDPASRIQYSAHVTGGGPAFFDAADRMGLEGIVSKKRRSRYSSGSSKSWLKVKTFGESEFVVIGVERGDRAPVALLARETDQDLEYAGGAMVTLPDPERERFWEAVEELKVRSPALSIDRKLKEGSWIRPELNVRVKHLRGEEMLRHATVLGLVARQPEPRRSPTKHGRSEPSYPKPSLPGKQARLDYYRQVAPLMLPHLEGRILNLFRCPDGECFFQRNARHPATSEGFDLPIRKVPIEQKNGRTEEYLYVEDAEGILACVAAETVEFHGWGSRAGDVERPDRIAIDLDPGEGVGFEAVRDAAFQVRRSLQAVGLNAFALLTGGKGIHVVVPFAAEAEWPEVEEFARTFCAALAGADADRFTVSLPKEKREGRIFLDYLRNHRTATAIMPYSLRAKPGAPVAAPVDWDQLREIGSATAFSIADFRDLPQPGRWGVSGQRLPLL